MTAQPPYTVVRAFPGFDVRSYPDRVLVQVRVDGNFTRAANRGFRPLQEYLGGRNSTATTLPMLPPVLQERAGESGHLISVALPGESDPERVPVPLDESLRILAEPTHEAAVLRFGGGWSTKRFTERGRELLGSLASADLLPDGPVYYAWFDPPFRPGLLGHNEALVRVTSA